MALRTFTIAEFCAGAGMLGLGLHFGLEALGGRARTVVYVERDCYSASTLVARMEDEALDPAPIADCLESFDGAAWRGLVDCVVAGIPCQGNSLAGNRQLEDDPRNLWPICRRRLCEIEPEWFFLENVYGFVVPDRAGGRAAPVTRVCGELAEMGYDAEWGVLSASAVGASHQRERIFVLAHRNDCKRQQPVGLSRSRGPTDIERRCTPMANVHVADTKRARREASIGGTDQHTRRESRPGNGALAYNQDTKRREQEPIWGPQGRTTHGGTGEALAELPSGGQRELRTAPERNRLVERNGEELGDTTRHGLGDARGKHGDDELGHSVSAGLQGRPLDSERTGERTAQAANGTLPLFTPGRDDFRSWAAIASLDPSVMPCRERPVRGLPHGLASGLVGRNEQLRVSGNGVVALQAACAFVELYQRLTLTEEA